MQMLLNIVYYHWVTIVATYMHILANEIKTLNKDNKGKWTEKHISKHELIGAKEGNLITKILSISQKMDKWCKNI